MRGGRPGSVAARARTYRTALWRTLAAVWNDSRTDEAAALTYYAVLAIFPMLLVTVSVVGLALPGAPDEVIGRLDEVVPAAVRPVLRDSLGRALGQSSGAWLLIVFGTVSAMWSASSYLSVFRRMLHSLYGVADCRPAWRKAPRIVLTALAVLAVLISSTAALSLSGTAAGSVGRLLRLGGTAVAVWGVLQWPVMLVLAVVLVLVVFRTGPAAARSPWRTLPGGALAVALWLLSSFGVAFYAAHVNSYSRLYGSLAGTVVFLLWLWLSNLALVVGAQFNAVLAGAPAGSECGNGSPGAAVPGRGGEQHDDEPGAQQAHHGHRAEGGDRGAGTGQTAHREPPRDRRAVSRRFPR
ncbi:hypothetical protein SCATT_p12740 (plasmid) [Streptantibioticus cattleyicolor NRRL 8057 = DSM 46488]|uniref:Uncharacterized protein n=1 Tax=Streptantibioticus cattleyicolor (strain ATCC 35852 / DSM 46488 / JCM 4925 / NBRC 14057 / NRRL 8057) TaxID=1003195 RepID=G8XFC5_STREN|nr:hypothetical protein SCATT_p12740 [Streptantibioticus cattleyicolor NRRL 8057 = DSM 46488]